MCGLCPRRTAFWSLLLTQRMQARQQLSGHTPSATSAPREGILSPASSHDIGYPPLQACGSCGCLELPGLLPWVYRSFAERQAV